MVQVAKKAVLLQLEGKAQGKALGGLMSSGQGKSLKRLLFNGFKWRLQIENLREIATFSTGRDDIFDDWDKNFFIGGSELILDSLSDLTYILLGTLDHVHDHFLAMLHGFYKTLLSLLKSIFNYWLSVGNTILSLFGNRFCFIRHVLRDLIGNCFNLVVKMFFIIVTIFGVCWLPYHAYFIYAYHDNSIVNKPFIQHVYLFFYWLAMSNTMVNPIVYYWMNKREISKQAQVVVEALEHIDTAVELNSVEILLLIETDIGHTLMS
ncbi:hypothetical protein TCAL_17171 [Tigriopus californicus]|uniref:G-protein coupled receptors family 1 profile domain-containing protein n=1 Tax=Tigriopus californicus TaxID=6832 RepID=A0A553N9G4_TIGCA|nr:hypothetical protein TCAL_17171 [Tigriopus californicus]